MSLSSESDLLKKVFHTQGRTHASFTRHRNVGAYGIIGRPRVPLSPTLYELRLCACMRVHYVYIQRYRNIICDACVFRCEKPSYPFTFILFYIFLVYIHIVM